MESRKYNRRTLSDGQTPLSSRNSAIFPNVLPNDALKFSCNESVMFLQPSLSLVGANPKTKAQFVLCLFPQSVGQSVSRSVGRHLWKWPPTTGLEAPAALRRRRPLEGNQKMRKTWKSSVESEDPHVIKSFRCWMSLKVTSAPFSLRFLRRHRKRRP